MIRKPQAFVFLWISLGFILQLFLLCLYFSLIQSVTVRVKGGMSLRNGMWYDLRNGIIYAEYHVIPVEWRHEINFNPRSFPIFPICFLKMAVCRAKHCQINKTQHQKEIQLKRIPGRGATIEYRATEVCS